MGDRHSTDTRVVPVFDWLLAMDETGHEWLKKLLALPVGGNSPRLPPSTDFSISDSCWGREEKAISPPVSLLSWIIRHPRPPTKGNLSSDPAKAQKRQEWIEGSNEHILEGLALLRDNPGNENWHVFEGETKPDVYIETPDLLVVIEGKRTERSPTTSTKWMAGRHQMLRHIDGAWETAGTKRVLGFFIVETASANAEVPKKWLEYAQDTISPKAIEASLPHRGPDEQSAISACFLGVTTWQRVCLKFRIPQKVLPDTVQK